MFNSALRSNGTFFAGSNGLEMVKRERDRRRKSYLPRGGRTRRWELVRLLLGRDLLNFRCSNLPVTWLFGYPINSMVSLDDGKTEMAVITDATYGWQLCVMALWR